MLIEDIICPEGREECLSASLGMVAEVLKWIPSPLWISSIPEDPGPKIEDNLIVNE